MPGGDRTGPAGLGPMTGRAAGYCAGYPVPGYMNPIGGRGHWGWGRGWGRGGFGRGRGWGRGWGVYPGYGVPYGYPYPAVAPYAGASYGAPYGYPDAGGAYGGYPYAPPLDPKDESAMLKDQAKAMQEDMKSINERIAELESAAKSEGKK